MDTNDFKPKPPAPDTVANREFSINFELLSNIATLNAYGSANANIDGSVIIRADIDSNGKLASMVVLESSNKVLTPIAMSSLKKYFKKYQPKVAKKDGLPIETKSYLVPIIFDMSIIENNKQPIEGNNKK